MKHSKKDDGEHWSQNQNTIGLDEQKNKALNVEPASGLEQQSIAKNASCYNNYIAYEAECQTEIENNFNKFSDGLAVLTPDFTFADLTEDDFITGRVYTELAKLDLNTQGRYKADYVMPHNRALGKAEGRANLISPRDFEKALTAANKAKKLADKEAEQQKRMEARAAKKRAIAAAGGIDVNRVFLEPSKKDLDEPADKIINYERILEQDPNLSGIAFNLLKNTIDVQRTDFYWAHAGNGWRDEDISGLQSYVQDKYGILNIGYLEAALKNVAIKRAFHPVKEYLETLPPWDGIPRIEAILINHMGADDTAYVRAVTRKWMITAITRIYKPGIFCKQILILDGAQDAGKSKFFQTMAVNDDWWTASLSLYDMRTKEGCEKIQGFWIIEIPEMAGMKKADLECVKMFISNTHDKFRMAYGHHTQTYPRQCVFGATVNGENGYLQDTTGNSRYLPVKVKNKKEIADGNHIWEISKEYLNQLWAEALFYSSQGEGYLLPKELDNDVEDARDEATIKDERADLVKEYLELKRKSDVTGLEIWTECFYANPDKFSVSEQRNISKLMTQLPRWERSNHIKRNGREVNGWKYEQEIVEPLEVKIKRIEYRQAELLG
jgi:hypothetical protein